MAGGHAPQVEAQKGCLCMLSGSIQIFTVFLSINLLTVDPRGRKHFAAIRKAGGFRPFFLPAPLLFQRFASPFFIIWLLCGVKKDIYIVSMDSMLIP